MVSRLDSRAALYCHEYLHKKYAPKRFPGVDEIELKGIAELLAEAGNKFEKKVLEKLEDQLGPSSRFLRIDKNDDSLAQLLTAKALTGDKYDFIYGASIAEIAEKEIAKIRHSELNSQVRTSKPDILVRIPGTSFWMPVDIKSHNAVDELKSANLFRTDFKSIPDGAPTFLGKLKKEDAIQLAHYYVHLQDLGLASEEAFAGIIGKDAESIHWQYLSTSNMRLLGAKASAIDVYNHLFAQAEYVIKQAKKRNEDSDITAPSIPMVMPGKMGCKTCGYKVACEAEIKSYKGSGHVTYLAGITPSKLEKLPVGIDSIDEVASMSASTAFQEEAQLRAQVWKTQKPLPVDPTNADKIPRFDIEIDIDLENSQAALLDEGIDDVEIEDFVFMYGYLKWDRTLEDDWKQREAIVFEDWTNSFEGQKKVQLDMWNFLVDEVEKAKVESKSIGIYHYSPHERTKLKAFARIYEGQPGIPSLSEIEDFMAKYFVDMYPLLKKWVLPAKSYSIKDLAPLVPFKWSVPNPGGDNALAQFKEAIHEGPVADAAREWMRAYNKDDVRATAAFRDWFNSLV